MPSENVKRPIRNSTGATQDDVQCCRVEPGQISATEPYDLLIKTWTVCERQGKQDNKSICLKFCIHKITTQTLIFFKVA